MKKQMLFVVMTAVVIALFNAGTASAQQSDAVQQNRIPVQVGVSFKYDPNYNDKRIKNEEALRRLAVATLLQTHPELQLRNGDSSVLTGIEMRFSMERVAFQPPPASKGQIIASRMEQYGRALCENASGRAGRIGCMVGQTARNYLISRAPRYVSTWRYHLDVLSSMWDNNQKKWIQPTFGLSYELAPKPFDVSYDVIYWADGYNQGQIVLLHGTDIEVGETWMDEGASMLIDRFFGDPNNLHSRQLLQPLQEAIAQRKVK